MITLTDEQEHALSAVADWYGGQSLRSRSEAPFRLFGPAGTGKTTLARHLAGKLGIGDVVFGAYTGKAASVLARRGVPATTIHSAIYKPMENYQARMRWEELTTELAELLSSITPDRKEAGRLEEEIGELEAELRRPGFRLNPMSEWASADLIVLDEVSMVTSQMADDIESFGVPVLVLGDPFQLPPIQGAGHYTAAHPDVLLHHIHRQALESPVLGLATDIRRGTLPEVTEIVSIGKAAQYEQILCWRNATRWKLINAMRSKLGHPAGTPVAGDRVICTVNNRTDLGILNGQQFDVLAVDGEALLLRESGTDAPERWIQAWPEGFTGLAGEDQLKLKRAFRGSVGAFTFANAVTVHKAQGSEWESVYVVDETRPMIDILGTVQARRWLYTAVTRARESVHLARLKSG